MAKVTKGSMRSLFLTDVTGTDTANVNHDGLVCVCV